MGNNEVLRKRVDELAARVNGKVEEMIDTLVLTVQSAYITETLTAVKSFAEVPCDFLHDIAGVDKLTHFEVVYQMTSLRGPQKLRVKAIVDREKPVIDSVTRIWAGANFMEREAYDMFGIQFTGHPNLKRIYMWDDFEGFPLRKDYVTEPVEVRNTMRVRRDDE
ncbi:NADH/F420H2 dehydrogenase, subunit C [Desulfitobacterium dichloroeliminans LMG P-21439]|uniref:NADH-quinone oxidoreductase subunit C n=1 Tax=Desulfitobacterium dichloroeliminans (strain LMG P-21439 / DCA1) TaxID=871963 RepID=L0F8C4_DESDL|nr:NADH-quinone oxidoreductase subunit C [Desulfitobacterium dichloroeliminans]AGA70054.1 NADH/F420H2 dehydrogenase, subunit C [Desulfitobacterium dichloroeliminans LMG P-21439]